MATAALDKADVLARLDIQTFYAEYLDLKGKPPEMMARCPFHEDDNPSLGVNMNTGLWRCHGCQAHGDVFGFYEQKHNVDFKTALQELADRNGCTAAVKPAPALQPEPAPKPISEAYIRRCCDALEGNPKAEAWLKDHRGFNEQSIDLWQIGMSAQRYSLPIRDDDGRLVNVRLYKPEAKSGEKKWLNTTGYGSPARLWPRDGMSGDSILLCEGEFDTILAYQHGYHAITGTGGCGVWQDEWTPLFKEKVVTICYDNDEAGRQAAVKVAEKLSGTAAGVRILNWPRVMPDKGDLTDFFVNLKLGKAEFDEYVEKAPDYTSSTTRRMPRSVRNILPQNGFLRSYVSYATELTDAPPEFHLATGLTLLSAAAGNRITFPAWGQDVCLNLWSILLAPSGFYRKSTAMNIGLRLLRYGKLDCILPDDFSRERFIENLAARPAAVLPVFEFGELLSKLSRDYMAGSKELLTHLYDSPDEYIRETKGSAPSTIKKPAVGILAASTIDWIQDRISAGDLRGGFMARFLFWPAFQKLEWKGMTPPPNSILQRSLVEWLVAVSRKSGTAIFPPKQYDRYNTWVRKHEDEVNQDKLPAELQGFYTRLATYVGKLAVLYQLGHDCTIEVSEASLEQAIRTATYLKSHLINLLEKELAITKEEKRIKLVREIITQEGEIEHGDLLRRSRLMKRDLDQVIDTLVESEQIERVIEKTGGRPKRTYKPN
jgi:hypothetical protein